jgi:hypothetical protein
MASLFIRVACDFTVTKRSIYSFTHARHRYRCLFGCWAWHDTNLMFCPSRSFYPINFSVGPMGLHLKHLVTPKPSSGQGNEAQLCFSLGYIVLMGWHGDEAHFRATSAHEAKFAELTQSIHQLKGRRVTLNEMPRYCTCLASLCHLPLYDTELSFPSIRAQHQSKDKCREEKNDFLSLLAI